MRARIASVAVFIVFSIPASVPHASNIRPADPKPAITPSIRPWFEPRAGSDGGFIARGRDYIVRLTPTGADLIWRDDAMPSAVRMELVGANPNSNLEGTEPSAAKAHYYVGNDPTLWRIDVPMYSKVRVANSWPGIDAVFYTDDTGRLEYDFIVSPGATPSAIVLQLSGLDEMHIDATGDLIMQIDGRQVVQRKPVIHQTTADGKRLIDGGWRLHDRQRVGFEIGSYDRSKPLVIDPVFVFSTFLGGSRWDLGYSIATDGWGHTYVAGTTESDTFPPFPGGVPDTGNRDAFVAAFDASGVPMFVTYLGGTGANDEGASGIAVDPSTSIAYVTGWTGATDFPTTPGAFQASDPDATFDVNGALTGNGLDAFVTALGFWGRPIYSTYLGDTSQGEDRATGIAVDAWGLIYVTGMTDSGAFPTTVDAFQRSTSGFAQQDIFVTVLDSLVRSLLYSTYLGAGWEPHVAVGPGTAGLIDGFVVAGVTGPGFPTTLGAAQAAFGGGRTDGFVTRFAPWTWTPGSLSGSPTYSTYLGAGGDDWLLDVEMDNAGNAFVAGGTLSTAFPTTPGAFQAFDPDAIYDLYGNAVQNNFDGFATKLDSTGAVIISTYLGGADIDYATAIAVDSSANVHVAGSTWSMTDFPLFAPLKFAPMDWMDMFLTKLDAKMERLLLSTYIGGESAEYTVSGGLAVDAAGHVHMTGHTTSQTDFPLVASYGNLNNDVAAFVMKVDPAPTTADISITHTVTSPTVPVGGHLAYLFRVFNNTGPAIATNLVVRFSLSPGQTLQGVTATVSQMLGGTGTPQTVPCWTTATGGTCTVRALSIGGMVTVRVDTKATVRGKILSTATVVANEPDPTVNSTTAAVGVF